MLRVNREEYATLAAPTQDRPGRNKDGEIADQMRSFLVPDSFKESESKNVDKERFINIMFALECSNGDVWLFIDHSRLMRFEVHSRGTDWSDDDVRLESEVRVFLGQILYIAADSCRRCGAVHLTGSTGLRHFKRLLDHKRPCVCGGSRCCESTCHARLREAC